MIENLQKKLTALFMGVSFLLFLGIFVLLIVRDVQSAHMADRAMFQNQFTSLSYQIATGSIANQSEWEQSFAVLRLTNEAGTILWQTNGGFQDVIAVLWEHLEQQLGQMSVEQRGELPAIHQSNILVIKASDGTSFIASRANIQTPDGSMQTLEMLLPQTSVISVLQQNALMYFLLFGTVLLVLGLLSHFLVLQALKPARRSLQSQKNFIAAASHELKTPLSVIQLNNAEVKNMVDSNSKASGLLDVSLMESERMARLISDMLALASSDAGYWKFRMAEINIETLLLQAFEKHSPAAGKKDIEIQMDLPANSFSTLLGDQERIAQVLDVFIDNAIRFSPPGEIITIQARQSAKDIFLSVIDHGSGVSDKNKALVFERFFQEDRSRTQRDNFGLGLSIAKEIMDGHNGKIEVRNTLNGGATFTLCLSSCTC